MCGICGFVGDASHGDVARMLQRIAHRGPDDEGIYESAPGPRGERAILGHRRLAIIDLSPAGHQPMVDASGKLWLTFNGEIYNYRELREELRDLGHEFRSNSDSEVLLAGYRSWGVACLDRLVGQFAFAIWDDERRSLFAARDRLGEKPFYWTRTRRGLAFASEIKAFLDLEDFRPELDREALHQYLTFIWVPDPRTMFRDVWKLPPGHWLSYQEGDERPTVTRYWDVDFNVNGAIAPRDWEERILDCLGRAVERQMVADVPLGAFLSGGVDSSLVVALMTERSGRTVKTYTAGARLEDQRYDIQEDDARYARQVARLFDCDASECVLQPDVIELLPKLVYQMDEPVADPAIITSYLICREARQTLTVLLSGMGGDELFAGYPRQAAMRAASYYNALPRGLIQPVVEMLPGSRPGRFNAPFRNLKKLARSAALPWHERYLGFGTYYSDAEKSRLYTGELREATAGMDAYVEHRRHLERAASEHPLNQLLYLDLKTFLPCLNLTYTDKTAMAVSLEVRVPFLDPELVALAGQVPPESKLRGFTGKWILKRAAERRLPREIVWRKKAGFKAPVRAWLVGEMREMVADLLAPQRVRERGLFDPTEVQRIVEANSSGREDNSIKVYQLVTLELWQRAFLDSRGA